VEQGPDLVALDAPRLLRRASLDLTGSLPSLEDLDAIEADPDQWESLRDALLEDPALEDRVVQMLAERWLTLRDEYAVHYYDYGLDETQEYEWLRSVGQEPLRFVANIVVEDRPWSEISTSETVMVDETLAAVWPVEGYPDGETGWHAATWTDGRPPVGVLASNGLWWSYPSDEFNQNRARASALCRLLLCEDLLSRPVAIDNAAELLEAGDVAEMVRTQPSCLSCHSTIEPISAALYGYLWKSENAVGELERYHPERELLGEEELGVEMAYWGEPVSGLGELGWAMSGDPRLYRCATETFIELMLRRRLDTEERPMVDRLEQSFLQSGATVRPLLREITDLPTYQVGTLGVEATDNQLSRELAVRVLSPYQVATVIEQLTGFRWTWEGALLMDYDPTGFRIMAGGVDGLNQSQPHVDPSVGSTLLHGRIAQAAAEYAVTDPSAGVGLLSGVDLTAAPDADRLDRLALQLWGRHLDDDEVAALSALWTTIEPDFGATVAWQSTTEALLRHPDFLTY